MAYEGCIYLIPASWMKMNESDMSQYQNIILTKYPEDRPNYATYIHVLKYFIETEEM